MGVKVTNNGYATISAGITSTDTTITLDSGQGARFPTLGAGDFFFGTLVDTSNNIEIVKVTARSSDSMTVVRGQDNTTARGFAIGDRFELRPTAALFESIPYDNNTTSTGSLALPVGTTAQAPSASTTKGHVRFDDDEDVIYYSDGVSWKKISSVLVQFTSLTGYIYAGTASSLTLGGTGFGASITVNFTQSSDAIDEDVSVTPASDTSATVTVPSAVYNNVTAGNAVTVTITNADGNTNSQNTTATTLPTGGTISNSGGYRIHTFTSSSSLVVPTGFSKSAEYLLVAGGGYGGGAGGGGAGGVLSGSLTISPQTYTIVVGGGASELAGNAQGNDGTDTTGFGLTANAGGGGGSYNSSSSSTSNGRSGGSGGGGGWPAATGGSATSGQGFAGGTSTDTSPNPYGSAGGGGASAVGGSGSSSTGGNGGNGVQSSINGTSYYWGGGGGGGAQGSGSASGNGGFGGGGGGANWNGGSAGSGDTNGLNNGGNGQAASTGSTCRGGAGGINTGGGGGGMGISVFQGGAGGSGIVIIRYVV